MRQKQKPPETPHVASREVLSPAGIGFAGSVVATCDDRTDVPSSSPCGDGRGARALLGRSIAAGELAIVSRGLISL